MAGQESQAAVDSSQRSEVKDRAPGESDRKTTANAVAIPRDGGESQEIQKAEDSGKKDKTVLVYTIKIPDANRSTSENLTEKVFLEMTAQPGIRVSFVRNEAKIEDNLIAHGALFKKALECSKVECAGDISRELGYDFSLLGYIERKGGDHQL
ncbi:hypothetical protein ACFL5V_13105, partial [Fibrobacterota bacterium]